MTDGWDRLGRARNSQTAQALDSGHSAAGCDWGVSDCGLQRMRGYALVGQEFPCTFFYQLSNTYGPA